jgi:hypothetical protein
MAAGMLFVTASSFYFYGKVFQKKMKVAASATHPRATLVCAR